MPITTCVFDAYGTLFDVAAAARQAASEPEFAALENRWQEVAGHWRLKQLQYTWLRAVADAHADFWEVTQNGLDWALEASGPAAATQPCASGCWICTGSCRPIPKCPRCWRR